MGHSVFLQNNHFPTQEIVAKHPWEGAETELPFVPAFPDQCPPHSSQHRQTKSCLK